MSSELERKKSKRLETQQLESSVLAGSVHVDDYAKEILRQNSLDHALRELELLKKQNLQLKGELARSAGDFTDEIYLSLKQERDALFDLVRKQHLEPETRKRKFPAVSTLFETRANALQALTPVYRLLNPPVSSVSQAAENEDEWYNETFKLELAAAHGEDEDALETDRNQLLMEIDNLQARQMALEQLNSTLLEKIGMMETLVDTRLNVDVMARTKQLRTTFYAWNDYIKALRCARARLSQTSKQMAFQAWRERAKQSKHKTLLAEIFAMRTQRFRLHLLFRLWHSTTTRNRRLRSSITTTRAAVATVEDDKWTLAKLRFVASNARVPAMMYAASRGMKDLVMELINEGAPVNLKDRGSGSTPLHAACEAGVVETVELLLEAGADAGAKNDLGETPLQRAVARRTGNVEVTMILLRRDAQLLAALTADGRPVLQLAVESRASAQLVSVLLEHNKIARVEQQQTKTGTTALHSAALLGDSALVKLLVEHMQCRAEDFPRDTMDYTPLHSACRSTSALGDMATIIDLLIDCGFQVSSYSAQSRQTPLHIFCQNSTAAAVAAGLESLGLFFPEVDVDFKDAEGNTALHYACFYHLREIAVELVRQGASLYLLNNKQESPLDLVPPAFAIRLLTAIRFPLFLSRAERDHRNLTICMVCKCAVNVGFLGRRVAGHCRRCGRLCCAKCGAHRSVLKWENRPGYEMVESEEDGGGDDTAVPGNQVHKICKHCAEILIDTHERSGSGRGESFLV